MLAQHLGADLWVEVLVMMIIRIHLASGKVLAEPSRGGCRDRRVLTHSSSLGLQVATDADTARDLEGVIFRRSEMVMTPHAILKCHRSL